MSDELKQEVQLERELKLKETFPPVSYEEWRKIVEEELAGAPFEKKLHTKTYEGIEFKPLYIRKDLESLKILEQYPGFEKFVRNTKIQGYHPDGWEINQDIVNPLAEDFNAALHRDIERGQNSISFRLDDASKCCLDADYADEALVGSGGVNISAIYSVSRAFNKIDLRKYPLHIDAGFSNLPFLMLFAAYLEKNNYLFSDIKGSITADPLNFLAEKGYLPINLNSIYDEIALSLKYIEANNSDLRVLGVSAYNYNSAGATAVQELAFAFATALDYFDAMTERGFAPEELAPRFQFEFGVGPYFFMEIAKLRAARYLWSLLLEQYSVRSDLRKIFIRARCSKFNQTVFDPYVNILRTTTETFSAVLGGADAICSNPFDECFGLPNEFSRRIARNIHLLLKEESHMDFVIDPAGGSYFVETLTEQFAEAALSLFKKIEDNGGMYKSLCSNFIQNSLEETFNQKLSDFNKRKAILVGVNMYANPKEQLLQVEQIDRKNVKKIRSEFLQKLRVSGDAKKDIYILENIEKMTSSFGIEKVAFGKEAFKNGATIMEIAKSLRAGLEEKESVQKIKIKRLAEDFEKLRMTTMSLKEKNADAAKIFLFNVGALKQYKARADFSRGFFEIGGFDIIYPDGFKTTDEAIAAGVKSNARIFVICSLDENYPELVPPLTRGIKEKVKDAIVILAGYPKDQVDAHKASGVDDFIFLGADAYSILKNLLNRIGAEIK